MFSRKKHGGDQRCSKDMSDKVCRCCGIDLAELIAVDCVAVSIDDRDTEHPIRSTARESTQRWAVVGGGWYVADVIACWRASIVVIQDRCASVVLEVCVFAMCDARYCGQTTHNISHNTGVGTQCSRDTGYPVRRCGGWRENVWKLRGSKF